MTVWLKQSTAVTVKIGPFIDETDGKTAETALTLSQADVRLSKNGGDIAQKNNATSCTHDELGYYDCPLSTTDTNTLGVLRLAVHESGALPVWQDFMIVPANVWDSLFGADLLDVSLVQVAGAAVSTSTAQLGVNAVQAGGTAWGSGAITAASIASDAIAAAKIATGALTAAKFAAGAIDAAALAADAGTEIATAVWASGTRTLSSSSDPTAAAIADAVWDEVLAGHAGAGSAGAGLTVAANPLTAGQIADGVWDEALADHLTAGSTGEALDGAGGGGASASDIADAVWDEVLSGHLTAGSTGKALSDAQDGDFITGSSTAAAAMKRAYDGIIYGQAATGTLSTTQATTNLSGFANDALNGRTLTVTSGSRIGQQTTITDYASTGGLLTFAALTGALANGDQFFIA